MNRRAGAEPRFGFICIIYIYEMPVTRKAAPVVATKKAATTTTKKAPVATVKKAVASGNKGMYVVVRAVIFNILENGRYVIDACKCKTLTAGHLKAVAAIQNTIAKNKIGSIPASLKKAKSGGAPVMPSEFFGIDSGRYFDISQVESLQTDMFADAALSRAEMPLKIGGAAKNSTVSQTMVKTAISEYFQSSSVAAFKVSADAAGMMRSSAQQHVNEVSQHSSDMSHDEVKAVIAKNAIFSHLRVHA